jgi:hypothetical protein
MAKIPILYVQGGPFPDRDSFLGKRRYLSTGLF